MKRATISAAVIAAFGISPVVAQPPGGPAAPPCDPDEYICGQQAPEDLVALGSDWVVAGAFSGPGGFSICECD